MRKLMALVVIASGLWILYWVDPESASFMPRCLFHTLTGWDCPACGVQRAFHQLLHGHLRAAFSYNPFLFISSPYWGGLVLCQWFDGSSRLAYMKRLLHHPVLVNIYLILLIAWWIGRNL